MAHNDKIFIKGLAVETKVGVFAWEQALAQRLILNVEMLVDTQAAGQSDDLSKSVDYKSVADRLTLFCQQTHFQLLESYAEKMAQIILTEFSVRKVCIDISKPNIAKNIHSVGVLIERESSQVDS